MRAATARSAWGHGQKYLLRLWWLGCAFAWLLTSPGVFAAGPAAGTLPAGNSIITGTATVNTVGTTLTINQSSAQVAINFTSFDIASNATVNIVQPGANSIALIRIGIGSSSPTASQIFGALSSNGHVFLVNPAGIVFGQGGQVIAGGLLASTLDMDPTTLGGGAQSFHFDNLSATASSVINQGTIQAAAGGTVGLLGGSISNSGTIGAGTGRMFLKGAGHAIVDFDGSNVTNVSITGGITSGSGTAVTNTGTLLADAGTVVLEASATSGLFTQMVNNSGVIQADKINGTSGVVRLAGMGGDVVTTNSVSASSGTVQMASDQRLSLAGIVAAAGSGGQVVLDSGADIVVGSGNPLSLLPAGDASSLIQTGSLQLNGVLATGTQNQINVPSGGLLSGTGKAIDVALASGGAIAPGAPGGSVGTLRASSLAWAAGGAINMQLGATPAASDLLALTGALTKSGSGSFTFHLSDGATPASTCGVSYPLISAGSIAGFQAADFSFDYTGANPGLMGTIAINGNSVVFSTPSCPQTITGFAATPASPVFAPGGQFTVSATGGASSNPVTFSVALASASICSAGGANGSAISMQGAGICIVLADQAAGGIYAAAQQQSLAVTISKAASSTAVSISPAAPAYGQTVTLTAALTAGAGGTVTFYDGAAPLAGCTALPVAAQQAQCTLPSLGVGPHSIMATYSGDNNTSGSASGMQTVTVGKAAAAVTLTAPAAPVHGQPVVLTAMLTAGTAGTVTFNDGTAPLAGCTALPVAAQQAQCTVPGLGVGTHSITAVYTGDTNTNGATSNAQTVTVGKASTTVSITAPTSVALGGTASVQVKVAVVAPGTGTPAGTVTMTVAGGAKAALVANLDATGSATLTTDVLPPGAQTLTVNYSGSGDYAAASAQVTLNAPDAAAVPALNAWALALLGLLVAGIGMRRPRLAQRRG
ncbi:beta strand repeat-containing protein [Comamonas odontotermitis]|uniref:beta strand repeat-containing protein n=1 Tax=Comamonas odontotermitis TaxID=379895 RepID=UPI00374FE536